MADIRNILKMYSIGQTSTTEDGRMLALSLAEIQTELLKLREELGKSAPVPTTVYSEINTEGLEAAIAKLTPLPPQNLDLNPVLNSYADTAKAIRELLGEVKTTNHRIIGLGGGGGSGPDPRHIIDIKRHISDADVRLDYAARSDTNPVYIGRAESGTLTSAPWSIQKLTYDASDRVTYIQVITAPWNDRSTLNWS